MSISTLLTLLVPMASAQSAWEYYGSTFGSGIGSGQSFIANVATRGGNLFLMLVSGGAVIAIIWGGIRMATSGGNEEGREAAKKTIMYAVAGVVLAVMSVAIMNFVGTFFSALN